MGLLENWQYSDLIMWYIKIKTYKGEKLIRDKKDSLGTDCTWNLSNTL